MNWPKAAVHEQAFLWLCGEPFDPVTSCNLLLGWVTVRCREVSCFSTVSQYGTGFLRVKSSKAVGQLWGWSALGMLASLCMTPNHLGSRCSRQSPNRGCSVCAAAPARWAPRGTANTTGFLVPGVGTICGQSDDSKQSGCLLGSLCVSFASSPIL